MVTHNPNVDYIVKNDLCTGCGICENVCPTNAISIQIVKGINVPVVDENVCNNDTGCSQCHRVCPGHEVNLTERGDDLFHEKDIKWDYYIGKYLRCYSGYSTNSEIRYHSASGGALSQFIIYLIETNIINGAVVTGFDKYNPLQPTTYIARNSEEVLNAKSSKYCPVSFHKIIRELKKNTGKYAIVGLPCHIAALRKMEDFDKELKEQVYGYIAIYCSGLRTFLSQDYICQKYGISRNDIKEFAYRDDGCLGYMKATYHDGKIIKIPYKEYYRSMHGFFTPVRCTLCVDHYGELADICFGDIHVGEYIKDEIGVNSIITRNKECDIHLQEAANCKLLNLTEISTEVINSSQVYVKIHKKGPGIRTAYLFRKLIGLDNPNYGITFKGVVSFKQVLKYFAQVLSRKIGAIRLLWPLIGFIDYIALRLRIGRRR